MSTGFPTFNPNASQQQQPPQGPQQPQGGAPGAQAPQRGQGMQAPAPPVMQLLGDWGRVAAEIGQFHPPIADKMNTIQEQCRIALTALAREHVGGGIQQGSQPQPTKADYSPSGY